jgi:ABC-2 type transport system ATP-binding protein
LRKSKYTYAKETTTREQKLTSLTNYAIITSNLTKTYKSKIQNPEQRFSFFKRQNRIVTAVDRVNLEIRKGELFGLLGRNGAGKTTLVKVLCTLLPPDDGTALVNGFDVVKQQMNVKRSIGTIFSVGERGFFWRLTGYANLEFYAAINNVPRNGRKERIMEVLELVGMTDKAFEVFQKYSGGMKRKLALARALLADPPILLLDEPTTGLDVISSRNIREFIRNDLSKKTGKTVLYTTHYIEEAAQICDRIAVMHQGRFIAIDTPEALRTMTKKGEAVDIVVKNMSDTQVNSLRAVNGITSVAAEVQDSVLGQTHLRLRLERGEVLSDVLDFFFGKKIKILNFKQEEPTLEDAFIELTGKGVQE